MIVILLLFGLFLIKLINLLFKLHTKYRQHILRQHNLASQRNTRRPRVVLRANEARRQVIQH